MRISSYNSACQQEHFCHFCQKSINSQERPCLEVVLRLVGLD
jgi:hypothetical protein